MSPAIPSEFFGMSISELLALLVLGKEVTKGQIKWIRRRIKELWDEREYGFTPKPELASELQKTSKSEEFIRFIACVGGNYRYLSLIKTSLGMEQLSEEGRVKTIGEIKGDVLKKHGIHGVRILNLGSTGALTEVIRYLSDFKIKHSYNESDMADYFDKIIGGWKEKSIFHKTERGSKALHIKIVSFMNKEFDLFFVFASGIAGDQAKRVIASLSNASDIRKRGYNFHLFKRKEDKTGRLLFTWVFEKSSSVV